MADQGTAYALTIHKAQGLTLQRGLVDAKEIWECGQTYVALSRFTKLKNVHLIDFAPKQVKTNGKCTEEYQRLTDVCLNPPPVVIADNVAGC